MSNIGHVAGAAGFNRKRDKKNESLEPTRFKTVGKDARPNPSLYGDCLACIEDALKFLEESTE